MSKDNLSSIISTKNLKNLCTANIRLLTTSLYYYSDLSQVAATRMQCILNIANYLAGAHKAYTKGKAVTVEITLVEFDYNGGYCRNIKQLRNYIAHSNISLTEFMEDGSTLINYVKISELNKVILKLIDKIEDKYVNLDLDVPYSKTVSLIKDLQTSCLPPFNIKYYYPKQYTQKTLIELLPDGDTKPKVASSKLVKDLDNGSFEVAITK